MRRTTRAAAATAALATVLAVSACGQSSQPAGGAAAGKAGAPTGSVQAGATDTQAFNDADVTFATQMIPHHASAIQMADMALSQTSNAEVKRLATSIKDAQSPEIETMSAWLKGWGKPVPAMTGQDMGSMGSMASGSMSSQEMAALGKAGGGAFDTLWLESMIKHHRSAVTMAQTELASGRSAEAKQLAQQIVDSQSKEITEMTLLLATLKK